MRLLSVAIGLVLHGIGINVANACEKYTDCLCTNEPDVNGTTPEFGFQCAEVDENNTVLFYPVAETEDEKQRLNIGSTCTPSVSGRRLCWCNLEARGGTCVYNRMVPPTMAPTITPSISLRPSISTEPSISLRPSVSSAPSPLESEQPSISSQPTTNPSISSEPSMSPSISTRPSLDPSISTQPSFKPSMSDWPTAKPSISSAPSMNPSISTEPSVNPSISTQPSLNPSMSDWPTAKPSISSAPSMNPSISTEPSVNPSISTQPSLNPSMSDWPTARPSISSAPSTSPSISTEPSVNPSISLEPSLQSESPSISAKPSMNPSISTKPSLSPSISSRPSVSPSMSGKPSVNPSISSGPTASPSISSMPSPSETVVNGTVFDDPNKSGEQDPGEEGSPGLIVQLYCKVDGQYELINSTVTDGNGVYRFELHIEGNCRVRVIPDDPDTLFTPPTDSGGYTPQRFVNYGDEVTWNVGKYLPLPCVEGFIFYDSNRDGVQDPNNPNEDRLPDQTLELYCWRGLSFVKEDTLVSDLDGTYQFCEIAPGNCSVKVVPSDPDYEFSPIVEGGNSIGKDGWSSTLHLKYRATINLLVGMYLQPPEANCAKDCPNKEIDPILGYHDCGWGIWNDCTCQCVCDPGICLSANSKCYDGCTTHLDFNKYGGCHPGKDCPWHPSKRGLPHCESSANFAGIHGLRETAELCCKQHFGNLNFNTCVQESKADVVAAEAKVASDLARKKRYYPDMHGRQNCVFGSDYDDWMTGVNEEWFLFDSASKCCGNWYPHRTGDCPDTSRVTPKQVDYKPYASEGYFYPHMEASNCRFGRNYPMWMASSSRHYLYTTPEECCHEWYPAASNCPLPGDDGVQEGYFWVVDAVFYPNWKGDGCAYGNDHPEWMADPTQRDTHLFQTARECCELWFTSNRRKCESSIVQTSFGDQVGGPGAPNFNPGTWYPSLNGKYECIDGDPPGWMLAEGYKDEYVFDSHAECCKAHYCQNIRGIVQSRV